MDAPLQELPVLTTRHPRVAVGIKPEGANEVSHLHRPEELAVPAVDDDAVLLTVADPDVATGRIDCEMSGRIAAPRAICFFVSAEIISPENS